MKINLGCGTTRFEGFVNLDIRKDMNPDILCDIRNGIPVGSGEVEEIKATAVIEHFTLSELQKRVLPELLRILAPGGKIEILVPDLRELARRYLEFIRTGETPYKRPGLGTEFLYDGKDINYWIMSEGAHKIIFDIPFLQEVMEQAGFETTRIINIDHNLLGQFKKPV